VVGVFCALHRHAEQERALIARRTQETNELFSAEAEQRSLFGPVGWKFCAQPDQFHGD
jgi:hypothetical protein